MCCLDVRLLQLLAMTNLIFASFLSSPPPPLRHNPLRHLLETQHREPTEVLDTRQTTESDEEREDVRELWLEQPLDHFGLSESSNRTWWMRYLTNSAHWKPRGPVIVFVGGEWEISAEFLRRGFVFDLARELGGLLFYTEHRYYGRSWPTENATVDSLRFLSSRQALADLANFIGQQKLLDPRLKDAPVVLVGGSYAGSLATWFTLLHPQLASAAWASSAPLVAKLDFQDYLDLCGAAIRKLGGARCHRRLSKAVQLLERGFDDAVARSLHLCPEFDTRDELDVAAFFNSIANYFSALVQSYPSYVRETCSFFEALEPEDDLGALLAFVRRVFWPHQEPSSDWCLDLSYKATRQLFSDVHNLRSAARPWFYQCCHEFGWFTTTPNVSSSATSASPFGTRFPLAFFERLCADVFPTVGGPSTSRAELIDQTNARFGGLGPPFVDVVMTHGQLDPWRALGRQRGRRVFMIPGASHTADLGSINANDSVALNLAKIRVASFVRGRVWGGVEDEDEDTNLEINGG